MSKNLRVTFAIIFAALLLTEIGIALFVHDRFIRPYIGDVLVTILICCLFRAFVPESVRAFPIYVFIFATLVEVAQYLNVIKLLGLENNAFFSTIIGTTFSAVDLICYGFGCLLFWIGEKRIRSFFEKRNRNNV